MRVKMQGTCQSPCSLTMTHIAACQVIPSSAQSNIYHSFLCLTAGQVAELSDKLEKLRIDADYLRARAARAKAARPRLSLANALSLSIAPGGS